MRPSALFVLVLAGSLLGGCTPPPRPVTPLTANGTATSRPASDLAHAKQEVVPHGEGGKLVVKDPRITDLDIIKVTVDPASGQTTSVASADLFRQAGEAVAAKRTQEAISLYRRVVSEFPDSIYGPISLFNIAAIHDGRGDYLATVETLHELVKTFPAARESVEGHLYIAALHAEHKDFAEASKVLDAALARSNLSYADRVEAFARKGYVELELGHLDVAEAALEAAFGEWKKAPRLDDPYYIAMAAYYRGEVAHQRFEALPVRLPDDQLLKDVEQKRVLAGRAYDRWKESLQHHQAYWATAAGYQMSQIFVELWDVTVRAPYPTKIATAARPTYVAELHDKSREHLEKALEGHRMNVELAKAYGVDTSWSRGSELQATRILETLARDASGNYVTP